MSGVNNIQKGCFLTKIKSKYILRQIVDNIRLKKLLEFIRYNKNIQNMLDKRLKDYKNEYLKIEIEIIPKENYTGFYEHFVNVSKRQEIYFHIYFKRRKKV